MGRTKKPAQAKVAATAGETLPAAPAKDASPAEPEPRARGRRALSRQEQASSEAGPAASLFPGGAVLSFEVAGQRYGLPVGNVVQIIEMVTVTPLPAAPPIVAGVVDFHGRVIPVVDVRRRLRRPAQGYSLRTPIVISQTAGRTAGLIVDAVSGVVEIEAVQVEVSAQIFAPETAPPTPLVKGVARLSDGLLLILDLATFLTPEEEKALEKASSR